MIQSGDGDWIINSHPSGIVLRARFMAIGHLICMFWRKDGFLFGGLSPPNKKRSSLRPPQLCGENPILDKNVFDHNINREIAVTMLDRMTDRFLVGLLVPSCPPPVSLSSIKIPKWMEGWLGLLERIHGPLPLSEDLIVPDPT